MSHFSCLHGLTLRLPKPLRLSWIRNHWQAEIFFVLRADIGGEGEVKVKCLKNLEDVLDFGCSNFSKNHSRST